MYTCTHFLILFACIIRGSLATLPYENEFYYGKFPKGFKWGTATASYQIEGGWDEDGRGASIWDTFSHSPGNIINNDTGDVACDSYHKYKEDVALLKGLEVTNYRFSISWPRIFPTGSGQPNQKGVQYYHNLLNELEEAGIEPMVTMYHWDLPQAVEDLGGWPNASTADMFVDYADFLFKEYGNKVKFWITFNEPWDICYLGYGTKYMAPGSNEPGRLPYQAAHTVLKAHAKTYRLYNRNYKNSQKGQVGITLNTEWTVPKNPSSREDLEAAERAQQFKLGWFAHPIYGAGDYPEVMRESIDYKSQARGLNESRLPVFNNEEIRNIKGTFDFFGLNFYTSKLVSNNPFDPKEGHQSYTTDTDIITEIDPNWPTSGYGKKPVTPWGIRKMLNWIKDHYGSVDIYITENGVGAQTETLNDVPRVNFYRLYINEVLKAVRLDGCNVKGYTAWSLMDNFEWGNGYSLKFGIHYVDFEDPERPRKPKASALFYHHVILDNGFTQGAMTDPNVTTPLPYENEFLYGRFPDNFVWSTATASYQIEGGWNEDVISCVLLCLQGKDSAFGDVYSHEGLIQNGDTGDIACDSYHKYMQDIKLLKDLKVTHYRFSMSWPRILPKGTTEEVNPLGIAYYDQIIDALLDAGITPMVTLYHWDLPQALEDRGGWLNQSIVDWFMEYTRICFKYFGDRVKLWITLNEPWAVANLISTIRPRNGSDLPYRIGHNLISAHSAAYKIYNEEFRKTQKGQIGIALSHTHAVPKNKYSPSDFDAAERYNQLSLGWFANPIFGDGDYPDVMKLQVSKKSLQMNLTTSRLPEFTKKERQNNKGSADFLGLNLYTSRLASNRIQTTSKHKQTVDMDMDVLADIDPSWPGTGSPWMKVTPSAIRLALDWIKTHYNNPMVYITENGMSDNNGTLNDVHRIRFYQQYINEVLKAIKLDGCDVKGFTAWSLLDNFEWMRGYTDKFGLHYVNFSDPERRRVPKQSARYYTSVIGNNGFIEQTTDRSSSVITEKVTGRPMMKTTVLINASSNMKTISFIFILVIVSLVL